MSDYDSSADKIRIIAATTGWSLQHVTQEDVISYLTIAFICYQFVIQSPRAVRAVRYWCKAIKHRLALRRAKRHSLGG